MTIPIPLFIVRSRPGGKAGSIGLQETGERPVLLMIKEAALCLEDGIIDRPELLDAALIFGIGFPPFRGGLLRYADRIGAAAIVAQTGNLCTEIRRTIRPPGLAPGTGRKRQNLLSLTQPLPARQGRFPVSSPALLFVLLTAALLAASGCGYMGFYSRHTTLRALFENKPRMSLIQRFAPEDSLLVTGKMVDVEQDRGPLLLVAASSQYRENEIVALTTVRDPFEGYTLFLPAGYLRFLRFCRSERERIVRAE